MTTIRARKSSVSAIPTRSTDAPPASPAKFLFLSVWGALFLGAFVPSAAQAENLVIAANESSRTPTLQQRRSAAHGAEIRKLQRHCQVTAKRHRLYLTKKCAGTDRLDARTNICYPRKALFQPYLRWDSAAGRCKPRHRFDGGSCAGGKRRYNAGKHHAQSAAQSLKMYSKAPQRAQASLNQCRRALTKLRRYGAAKRAAGQRDCKQAQTLKRPDLVRLYCR